MISLKWLENIVGVGTFLIIVMGAWNAYQYGGIFPMSYFLGIVVMGFIWSVLYLWNLYKWWRMKKLFFTKAYRFPTMLTFTVIIIALLYLNYQRPDSAFVTLRLAIAFSFFLMIIANIKNFINFENAEVIQFQDKGISVRWSHLENIELDNDIFRFTTDKGKVYEVPLQEIHDSRRAAFLQQIHTLIERHKIDTTLRHLIVD